MAAQGKIPSSEQLASFLAALSASLFGGLVSKAPFEVKAELGKQFSPVWDGKAQAPPAGVELSLERVTAWLEDVVKYYRAQVAAKDAERKASLEPTAEELDLSDLSAACTRLWALDSHRLTPGVHYELDLQQGKGSYQTDDRADRPLFMRVDPTVLKRPTVKAFIDLLDNYERAIGHTERVTQVEVKENRDFINLVMESSCMEYTVKFLATARGKDGRPLFKGTTQQFKKMLYEQWFNLYRRGTNNDSCGFEHVFVGEVDKGQVKGMHNWINIYLEEKAGRLDYKGYIKPRRRGRNPIQFPAGEEQVQTIQFEWEGDLKPVGTSMIGVSPEFEMALYTLLLFAGAEENNVTVGPYKLLFKVFTMDRRNPKIGTAFPETVPLSPEEAATKLQAIARGRQVRGIGGIYAQPGSALSGKPTVGPRSPPVGGGRAAPKPPGSSSRRLEAELNNDSPREGRGGGLLSCCGHCRKKKRRRKPKRRP